jgi:hypothetical protein
MLAIIRAVAAAFTAVVERRRSWDALRTQYQPMGEPIAPSILPRAVTQIGVAETAPHG